MIGRSVPWMAAFLAGFLALAASAQSVQDQRPANSSLGVGTEHGGMTWEWCRSNGGPSERCGVDRLVLEQLVMRDSCFTINLPMTANGV